MTNGQVMDFLALLDAYANAVMQARDDLHRGYIPPSKPTDTARDALLAYLDAEIKAAARSGGEA